MALVEIASEGVTVRGNPKAPVTIVEVAEIMERIPARFEGKVKLVCMDFPISIPLELRLFESEVLEQVKEIEKIEMQRYVERLRQERDKIISSLKSEREALIQEEDDLRKEYERDQEEIERMEKRIKELRHELQVDLGDYESTISEFVGEIKGTTGTKKAGYGKVATLKEELVESTGGLV
uniref:Uncharacterized protein n=1 Tax=Candidatus Kentrum sp. MB TaxID=2138164 RepID=A0A450Y312_9GAMM|nr:MAG: protein of unknown function (DUF4407) [Candidatus Kentron sp. MB]VFK35951.1 MAG: protein of unknown function (DUF4407) [Candidatus Kentron sp. MB]VFK77555.1 MAG: protein of unknown function (DUF4407) [Candidatus Kentron sp. MB]